MKVVILHHDLENSEKEMKRIIEGKYSSEVLLLDIRKTNFEEIEDFCPDLILNRVYASVANRDYCSVKKTLTLLKKLDESSLLIVNSYDASRSDYSKFFAFNLMNVVGINTPRSFLYGLNSDLEKTVKTLGDFPIIVKRDSGGRGKDLAKCNNFEELKQAIGVIESSEDYSGGIILQEFCEPLESYDYRVWVVGGEAILYHKRTLISLQEDEPAWLASRSLGSQILRADANIPLELKKFCETAAEAINSKFDVLDIIKTKNGFCVIEHNQNIFSKI
ncbi:hypothetical protein HN604_01575 [archaeon]|nr:hypothetical protein [archaeon]